jgi:hypothetical protein
MSRTLTCLACCAGLYAGLAAGCAKARAATVPDGPPLAVPPPPARVVGPVEESPVTPAPVEPPPRAAVDPPPVEVAPTPARRPAASELSEPVSPAVAADAPRELRAGSTPADAEMDRKVRALLALSLRTLNQVDYRRLSAAGREQYDQARSFGEQAEQALTERNYVYAETLADKAAKLAVELAAR